MSAEYPAKLYVAVHDGNPGDIEFYRRRCEGAASILELGCGDARVLAALAEPGRSLVGVDIDGDLLGMARNRRAALAAGLELEFVEADMAKLGALDLQRKFDRVIIPYGGLYCLLDEAALTATLRAVARHLSPTGELILDVWAADSFHADAAPEDLEPDWLERVKVVEVDGQRIEVLEKSRWDRDKQRIDVTYLHVVVGEETGTEGLVEQRYLLAEQLRSYLQAVGLGRVEFFGDFEGGAYERSSGLLVVTASGVSAHSA